MSRFQAYQPLAHFSSICETVPAFLTETSVVGDYVLVTIQSHGLFLYHIPTKLNIASWSVSPETTFTCPAKFTLNPNSASDSVSGTVYAVLQTSDTWSKKNIVKNAGKRLCSWTFGDKTAQQIVAHNVPTLVKLLARPATALVVVCNKIGAVFESGAVNMMQGGELVEVKGSKTSSTILASQCFESEDTCTLYRLTVFDDMHEVQVVSLSESSEGNVDFDIVLKREVSLAEFSDFSHVQFNPRTRSFVFQHKQSVYSNDLDKKNQVTKLRLDASTLALLPLTHNHIVTAAKSSSSTLVTLIDISYGTKRHEISLPAHFDAVTITQLSTLDTGVCLIVSGTSIQPSKLETQIFLVPFHVEQTTLLESLGKARTDADSFIATCTMNILSIEDVEKGDLQTEQQQADTAFLVQFRKSKSEAECTRLFTRWVAKKDLSLVNHELFTIILTHLVESKICSLKIMKAMIQTRVALPSALITFLIDSGSVNLVKLALSHSNLSERDLVFCLTSILAQTPVNYEIVDAVFTHTAEHDLFVSHLKTLTNAHVLLLLAHAKSIFALDTLRATNLVSLLVDAHLPMLMLSKNLHTPLQEIQCLIQEESRVDYTVLFDFPQARQTAAATSERKRYNMLVKDASDTRDYSVDVISI